MSLYCPSNISRFGSSVRPFIPFFQRHNCRVFTCIGLFVVADGVAFAVRKQHFFFAVIIELRDGRDGYSYRFARHDAEINLVFIRVYGDVVLARDKILFGDFDVCAHRLHALRRTADCNGKACCAGFDFGFDFCNQPRRHILKPGGYVGVLRNFGKSVPCQRDGELALLDCITFHTFYFNVARRCRACSLAVYKPYYPQIVILRSVQVSVAVMV